MVNQGEKETMLVVYDHIPTIYLHGKSPTPIPGWQLPFHPKAVASGVVEVAIASILVSSSSVAVGEAWVKLFLSQVVTCWFYFSPRHCDSNLQDYTPEITFSRISQDFSPSNVRNAGGFSQRRTGQRSPRTFHGLGNFGMSGASEPITWGCRKPLGKRGSTWCLKWDMCNYICLHISCMWFIASILYRIYMFIS